MEILKVSAKSIPNSVAGDCRVIREKVRWRYRPWVQGIQPGGQAVAIAGLFGAVGD